MAKISAQQTDGSPSQDDYIVTVDRTSGENRKVALSAITSELINDTDSVIYNVRDYGATGTGDVDDTEAFQAAHDALPAGGGIIYIPPGDYLVDEQSNSAGVKYSLIIDKDNVTWYGDGARLITNGSSQSTFVISGSAKVNGRANAFQTDKWVTDADTPAEGAIACTAPIAKYASSIFVATPADITTAGLVAGDDLFIRTGQLNDAGANRNPDAEINKVVSVNASTGEIVLKFPTAKAYAQEYFIDNILNSGETSTTGTGSAALYGVIRMTDEIVRNTKFIGLIINNGVDTKNFVNIQQADEVRIQDCIIESFGQACIGGRFFKNVKATNNTVYHSVGGVVAPNVFGPSTGCNDNTFAFNHVYGEKPIQVHLHEGQARTRIMHNTFICATESDSEAVVSIRTRNYDTLVEGNSFINSFIGNNGNWILISDQCTTGGIIRNNRFRGTSGTKMIYCEGQNWIIENNDIPDAPAFTPRIYVIAGNTVRNNGSIPVKGKLVNTARSSANTGTTLTADPELVVPCQELRTYRVKALLTYDGDTAGDLKVSFTAPNNATMDWRIVSNSITGTTGTSQIRSESYSATQNTSTGALGAGVKAQCIIDGILVMSTSSGTLTLNWAQDASSATSTTVYAGSYLELSQTS